MHRGLRIAVMATCVVGVVGPMAAVVWWMREAGWSLDGVAVAAFGFLCAAAPYAPVFLTARYEPCSRRGLLGLLACTLVFGLGPVFLFVWLMVVPAAPGPLFALVIVAAFAWLIQLTA